MYWWLVLICVLHKVVAIYFSVEGPSLAQQLSLHHQSTVLKTLDRSWI